MVPSNNHAGKPNISVVTARLFEIILDMPFKDRRILLKELEQNYQQGRRKFPRKPYFMQVNFATAERAFSGYIQNISSGGVLIETRESLSVGEQVTLSFMRPKSRDYIKVGGKVVRTLADGFGVKFNTNIEDIVQLKAGDEKENIGSR
jgi:Tfp pilus assembly protein PilZ